MTDIGKEFDFPTVRKGSYILLALTAMVTARILVSGAEPNTVEALKGLLAAVAATHTMLVIGGGFINSKLSGAKEAVEETVTTTRTVAPKAPIQEMTVQAENVSVQPN